MAKPYLESRTDADGIVRDTFVVEALSVAPNGTEAWATDKDGNISNLTLTGTGKFADGTSAAPSVTFSDEVTLGLYRKSAGKAVFRNAADQDCYVGLQSGLTSEQRAYFAWYDYQGSVQPKWLMGKNSIDNFVLYEAASTVHIFTHYASASTEINSSGVHPVRINYHTLNPVAQTGSGGLEVYNGTATPALIGSITSSGVLSVDANGKGIFTTTGIAVENDASHFLGAAAGMNGFAFLSASGNERASLTFNGVSNAVTKLTDTGSVLSTTKDNASTINVFYDAAGASGAGYYVQNKRGASRTIKIILMGG